MKMNSLRAAVVVMFLWGAPFIHAGAFLSAQEEAAYQAALASWKQLAEAMAEIGLPPMGDPPVREDFIQTTPIGADVMDAASSARTAQLDEMRKWMNPGISSADGTPDSQAGLNAVRRQRLWASSAQALVEHAVEMEEARAWAEAAGFAEYGQTPDGRVMGLVGIKNGIPRYNISYNTGAAATIGVDQLWPAGLSGLGLTGSNVVMGIWDGGDVQTNHNEFSASTARVIDQDGISPLPVDAHPTAVAGTMAAGGVDASAKGMAFQSTLWAYDWNDDIELEMNSAYANDVRISNHSYGQQAGWGTIGLVGIGTVLCWWGNLAISETECYRFGRYEGYCEATDAIVYGNPHSLPVWAAGNERTDAAPPAGTQYITFINDALEVSSVSRPNDYDRGGYDTIADRGLAKNVLTVGAVSKITGGYAGTGSVHMAAFSSWGPTDDGRIKPDVVAAGVGVYTPAWYYLYPNAPNYYVTISGTSFAAPSVAGAAGLLVDLREQLDPQHPYWASTLKGILIHTTDETGLPGPDYQAGWGLVNAERAAEMIQADFDSGGKQFIKEVMLPDGDYIEFSVKAIGTEPLKATICWTDPAGPIQPLQLNPTNLVLVNDLDLRIIGPDGSTNHPWILNPALPSAAATTGDNFRDNVEQVAVTNAVADELFTIRITHKGTLVDDTGSPSFQAVSIILSGIEAETRPPFAISSIVVAEEARFLLWPSVVGQSYDVQSVTALTNQPWMAIGTEINATKSHTAWEVDALPSDACLFYRLIETN